MKNYGVLKAKAIDYQRDSDDDPHSELLVSVAGVKYRIAINVRSSRGPVAQRLVEYLIVHDLKHPVLDRARELPVGWSNLADGVADGAAIDYIRGNLFRGQDMKPIPHLAPGPNNDLFEFVEDLAQRAIADPGAVVYAFGEKWGPESGKPDQYFHFEPGNGVHLIHMNQGGAGENHGTFHDGGLIVDFSGSGGAVGLFIKFQNQVWHTDDQTADPIGDAPSVPEVPIPDTGDVDPWPVVAPDSPYHLARIVAAMVNPPGADPGKEFVTLLNASGRTLDLTGWKLLDQQDKVEAIAGKIEPGRALTLPLSGKGAQLSNKGGTITLLDQRGLKVDGVAYNRDAAKTEGEPVVFGG